METLNVSPPKHEPAHPLPRKNSVASLAVNIYSIVVIEIYRCSRLGWLTENLEDDHTGINTIVKV